MIRNNLVGGRSIVPRFACAGLLAALLAVVAPARAEILVQDARAELVAGDAGSVDAYFVLRNDTGHALELLKAEAPRARTVELKQRSYDAQNQPRIWPVAKLEIPAGGTARFVPAGRFFRLVGLERPARAGEQVTLTLLFEDEAPVTIQLTVQPTGGSESGQR